jgi:penicillin-binding protein 1A
VYPIEMVAAYSAFASLGTRAAPYAIVRVEDRDGRVLWQPEPVRSPVLSREEAYLMVSMMKDVNVRGTAYGAVWNAGFRVPSAGKTGTTNDGADAWYIGYTPTSWPACGSGWTAPGRSSPTPRAATSPRRRGPPS